MSEGPRPLPPAVWVAVGLQVFHGAVTLGIAILASDETQAATFVLVLAAVIDWVLAWGLWRVYGWARVVSLVLAAVTIVDMVVAGRLFFVTHLALVVVLLLPATRTEFARGPR